VRREARVLVVVLLAALGLARGRRDRSENLHVESPPQGEWRPRLPMHAAGSSPPPGCSPDSPGQEEALLSLPRAAASGCRGAAQRLRGGGLFECLHRSNSSLVGALSKKKPSTKGFSLEVERLGAGLGGLQRAGAQVAILIPLTFVLSCASVALDEDEARQFLKSASVVSWVLGMVYFAVQKRHIYQVLFADNARYVEDKDGEDLTVAKALAFYTTQTLPVLLRLLPASRADPLVSALQLASFSVAYPCLLGGNGVQSWLERKFGVIAVRKNKLQLVAAIARYLQRTKGR